MSSGLWNRLSPTWPTAVPSRCRLGSQLGYLLPEQEVELTAAIVLAFDLE